MAKKVFAAGEVLRAADTNVYLTDSRNCVINGGMDIWQRGTSFAPIVNNAYSADRWRAVASVAPSSRSVLRVALDNAIDDLQNVSYFLRSSVNTIGSGTNVRMRTHIEDVTTLANQPVVLSWWGKHTTATSLQVVVSQDFGSGGSALVDAFNSTVAYTTAWQRFEVTFTMPTLAGKTVGTNDNVRIDFFQAAATGSVLDITGVQLEAGSSATEFRRVGSSIQAELAACQRYYYRINADANEWYGPGAVASATTFRGHVGFPVTMRVEPSAVETTGTAANYGLLIGAASTASAVAVSSSTTRGMGLNMTSSGMTAGVAGMFRSEAANGFLGFSAEY